MSEIKSEYKSLNEQNEYDTHFFKTSADLVVGLGRMKSTAYTVGDVVYTDNNMQVALKCTTGGTTSADELDISGVSVGSSVEDGTCVWSVVGRISDSVPIGTIFAFGANEHPAGYLACDGTAVSRLVYADLFAVIGTTYGEGDGSTTFNLPNLNNNSFIEGDDTAGTVKSAGLPNITGSLGHISGNGEINTLPATEGALRWIGITKTMIGTYAQNTVADIMFDASVCNSLYGNSDTVQPKSVTVKFCIKAYGAITNAGSVELENAMKAFEELQSELDKEAGFIKPYAGDVVPSGYLPCNGSELSRSTYARLFSIIGTTYGAGDGSTTFNLPNLNNNSFLEGSNTAGTVKSAGLPNITGGLGNISATSTSSVGATSEGSLYWENHTGSNANGGSGVRYGYNVRLDASRSSAIYGNSDTVQPKSVTVKYCIKY